MDPASGKSRAHLRFDIIRLKQVSLSRLRSYETSRVIEIKTSSYRVLFVYSSVHHTTSKLKYIFLKKILQKYVLTPSLPKPFDKKTFCFVGHKVLNGFVSKSRQEFLHWLQTLTE